MDGILSVQRPCREDVAVDATDVVADGAGDGDRVRLRFRGFHVGTSLCWVSTMAHSRSRRHAM